MTIATIDAGRGSRRFPRLLGAAVLGACFAGLGLAGPAIAAQPIPLRAGLYCGPGAARIVVDVAHDRVEIDHMVCSFPVIAADHLQSDLCSKPDGTSISENFDFRVVGRDFIHAGNWYHLCGAVPQDVSAPQAPGAPAKTGG